MVEIAEIKDRDGLAAWLKDQPQARAVTIAVRTALRVVPVWWHWSLFLAVDTAHRRNTLHLFRCLLISSVATRSPENMKKFSNFADEAANAANFEAARIFRADGDGDKSSVAAYAAYAAADAAASIDADSGANAAYAASDADKASAQYNFWQKEIIADAQLINRGESLFGAKLWREEDNPFLSKWNDIQENSECSPKQHELQKIGGFWIAWYQAILDGTPMLGNAEMSWELQEKISLIDPEHWDAGPEVVNPMIQEIWELYRLRAEADAVQAELDVVVSGAATIEHRSHNQPPGLVNVEAELGRGVTLICTGLDEARAELKKEEPDKAVLAVIAERLLSALASVTRYCAKVADTAVIAAAKVGGGAVGTALLDHVVNNGRLLQFAKDLASFAGG